MPLSASDPTGFDAGMFGNPGTVSCILHFHATKADFEDARRATALLAKGGLERRAVTVAEMKEIEPALKGELYAGW